MSLTVRTTSNEPSGVGRSSPSNEIPGRGLDEDDSGLRGWREFEDFVGGTETDDAAAEDDHLRGSTHRGAGKALVLAARVRRSERLALAVSFGLRLDAATGSSHQDSPYPEAQLDSLESVFSSAFRKCIRAVGGGRGQTACEYADARWEFLTADSLFALDELVGDGAVQFKLHRVQKHPVIAMGYSRLVRAVSSLVLERTVRRSCWNSSHRPIQPAHGPRRGYSPGNVSCGHGQSPIRE